jgi:hypothetical protein
LSVLKLMSFTTNHHHHRTHHHANHHWHLGSAFRFVMRRLKAKKE